MPDRARPPRSERSAARTPRSPARSPLCVELRPRRTEFRKCGRQTPPDDRRSTTCLGRQSGALRTQTLQRTRSDWFLVVVTLAQVTLEKHDEEREEVTAPHFL